MRYALVVLLAVFLVACDKSTTEVNHYHPSSLTAGNNSATLTGGQVGSGHYIAAQLRAAIPASLQSAHASLELGQAYKARSTVDTTGVYWMVSVTNAGDEPLCNISAGGQTYLDAAGNAIPYAGSTVAKLYGNVGNTSTGSDCTCLAPGESGWLLGYLAADFDTLAALRFSYLADGGTAVTNPEARIIPQSYSYSTADTYDLQIPIENTGTWAGRLRSRVVAVLLYSDGTPQFWTNVNWFTDDGGIMEVGGGNILFGNLQYDGAVAMMQVFVDFEDLEEDDR